MATPTRQLRQIALSEARSHPEVTRAEIARRSKHEGLLIRVGDKERFLPYNLRSSSWDLPRMIRTSIRRVVRELTS